MYSIATSAPPHVAAILTKLQGRQSAGPKQWHARCPAHEDSNASLSIAVGKDGSALLNCHKGCTANAILASIGLTPVDLYAPQDVAETVAEYIYTLAEGTPSFRVQRLRKGDGTKSFLQQAFDGYNADRKPTWKKKKAGAVPVLYHWHEWAVTRPETMVLVEGEKDVETLSGLGIAATTMAGGADAGWLDSYSQALKDAGVHRVVVMPDNDAAGRTWAATVIRGCRRAGFDVRAVTLADHVANLAEKADISDVTESGAADADDVRQWIANAGVAPVTTKIRGVSMADVMDPTPPEPLWPNWMYRGKIHLLCGPPEVGKTFCYLELVTRWSDGREMPDGAMLPRRLRTLILTGEDGVEDTIAYRLQVQLGLKNREAVQVVGPTETAKMSLSRKQDQEDLIELIEAHRADVVIFDTLASLMGRSESEEEVRSTLAPLFAIAETMGIVILALKHPVKDRQRYTDLLASISGSGAYGALARVAWFFVKDEAEDRTILKVEKNNLGRRPVHALAFRITDDTPAITWTQNVDVDVKALWTGNAEKSEKRKLCGAWLQSLLAAGPVLATEVFAQGHAEGHSDRQIRGAAEELKVIKGKVGGKYVWRLPTADRVPTVPDDLMDYADDPSDIVEEEFMTH